jgi:hypothetical protein
MKLFAPKTASAACVSAVLLTALTATSAKAGLQDAIFSLIDSAEASDPHRAFVAPVAGLDDPGPCTGADCASATGLVSSSVSPKLIYDDTSGHLLASIPAASINLGGDPYPAWAKIYSIAQVSFDSRLFQRNVPSPNSVVLGWQSGGGPLEAMETIPIVSEEADRYLWMPTDRSLFPLSSAAALIDFGNVLPPGLTAANFARLSVGDLGATYVDYFNHRGVVSLHVPLTVVVVPEPTTLALLLAACLLTAASKIRRSRISAVDDLRITSV